MKEFKPRDQIAYIPQHAKGNINHPDVDFGFVVHVRRNLIFCRYWTADFLDLRTTTVSEGALMQHLVHHISVPKQKVNKAFIKYHLEV